MLGVYLTDAEIDVLCKMKMTMDPWPLTEDELLVFESLLAEALQRKGFKGTWLDFYHREK